MNYKQAIEANVKHMQTSLSEWTAVEMTGFVEVEAGGQAHTMPTFSFPQGYASAQPFTSQTLTGHVVSFAHTQSKWPTGFRMIQRNGQ